jgi:hypothetical protein
MIGRARDAPPNSASTERALEFTPAELSHELGASEQNPPGGVCSARRVA